MNLYLAKLKWIGLRACKPVIFNGIQYATDERLRNRLMVTNGIILFSSVLILFFVIKFFLLSIMLGVRVLLYAAPTVVVCFLLMRNGNHIVARVVLFLAYIFVPMLGVSAINNQSYLAVFAVQAWLKVAIFIPLSMFYWENESRWIVAAVTGIFIIHFATPQLISFLPTENIPTHDARFTFELASISQLILISMGYIICRKLDYNYLQELFQQARQSEEKYKNLAATLEARVDIQAKKLYQSEKLSAIGQMVSSVAHEINTPLAVIDHYLTIIERDVEIINKHRDEDRIESEITNRIIRYYVPSMTSAVSKIGEFTNSLLNFTRIEHNTKQVVDVNTILDSILVLLRRSLPEGIYVKKIYDEKPDILCFPGKLSQAFMHIITNAIQAIRESGTITIITSKSKNWVSITIKDTGIGIPVGAKDKVFDPFYTTKNIGEGVGLGLSIAYDVIHKHDGEIEIDSKEGGGTLVYIKLPVNINHIEAFKS